MGTVLISQPARPVLVVDDDDDLREMIGIALGEKGYSAVGIGSGVAALEWLRVTPAPALVLLDLKMPRLGGTSVLRALRSDPATARIPVVVISGDQVAGDLVRSL